MRHLLDTHALYWYVEGDPQLSATAEAVIRDAANDILFSPASYWEMAIKVSLGKWVLNRPFAEFIDLCLNKYRFEILPILPTHVERLIALPYPPKHNDPFDRLLVAQVLVENIPIISADPKLDDYPVTRVW